MVVAIEYGLDDIWKYLSDRGYTMVPYPDYKGLVDALIYRDKIPDTIETGFNNGPESFENQIAPKSQGVLIINGNNKNMSEIETILERRVYSPLF